MYHFEQLIIHTQLNSLDLLAPFYSARASIVSKYDEGTSLSTALNNMLSGRQWVSPSFSFLQHLEESITRPVVFTPLEEKIVALASIGLTSQEIAFSLNKKKSTVDSYRKAMIKKFRVANFFELVDHAKRIGKS